MASVKYVNGSAAKTTSVKAGLWNTEKIGNTTVYKFETDSNHKANISFAGNEWEIDKYYLSFPKTLSVREINYILNKLSPKDLIMNASLSISYTTQIEALRKECESITLTSFREHVWTEGYKKIMTNFTKDHIEIIMNINNLIFPYVWQITPLYDSIDLNGASITVAKGERIFVLQVL